MRYLFAALLVLLAQPAFAQYPPKGAIEIKDCFIQFGGNKWKAALEPCRRGAEAGDASAQARYAEVLLQLDTAKRNGKKVALWFCKSIAQGYGYAPMRLGAMHYNGYGFLKNEMKAFIWWLVAEKKSEGTFIAKEVREARRDLKLSPDQITKAKKRADAIMKQIKAGTLKRCD